MVISDEKRILNLVLGGGGIKGIAYSGVFDAAEKRGYKWGNIAGVSAGALAGSYAAAGYSAEEIIKIMDQFDFSEVDINNIPDKVPAVKRLIEIKGKLRNIGIIDRLKYIEIKNKLNYIEKNWMRGQYEKDFILSLLFDTEGLKTPGACRYSSEGNEQGYMSDMGDLELSGEDQYRAGILNNIISYCKNGCLFDGDYLEEWVHRVLAEKGVKTFADLRGGIIDSKNPNGYRMRMTAVDSNRSKVIVLPDDMAFYGIDPDKFEVAKAVRMSTSIPFVFKPVEIKKTEKDKTKVYNIIDGGVLDKFPGWLIESSNSDKQLVGFTLDGGKKKSLLSVNTPLNILKWLISSVYDIGVPKDSESNIKYIGKIDTSKVYYLDFNISKEDKLYLYESGKMAAENVFNDLESSINEKYDQNNKDNINNPSKDYSQNRSYEHKKCLSVAILLLVLELSIKMKHNNLSQK